MSCERFEEQIQELLDGELAEFREHQVREHLAGCPRCHQVYEQLGELRLEARRLPREVEPPHDLWPGIAARLPVGRASRTGRRLEAVELPGPRRAGEEPPAGRFLALPRWAWAAAAALAAAVGVLLLALPGAPRPESPTARRADSPATRGPSAIELAGLAELARNEDATLGSLKDLSAALERGRPRLDAETRRSVERDVRLLDRSIGELRAALDEHPTDRRLRLLLAARYRQESELARRLAHS